MLEVNFDPFPILETERLVLRQSNSGDADALFFLRSSEDVMRYIDRPRPKSINDILLLIEKIRSKLATNEGIEWAITLKGDPTYMGSISYHLLYKENHRAEIGYLLHPMLHGQGIMDEAIKAVLNYGFNKMGLHSIEAIVLAGNTASENLLKRNGFIQEAHFHQNHYRNGAFIDTLVFGLVRQWYIDNSSPE